MKLLVTGCTEEIPIAFDGVHEGDGSKVNDTTIEDEEEIANPLQNYRQQASESLVVNNNIHEIAPGEGLLTKKIYLIKTVKSRHFHNFLAKVGLDICRKGNKIISIKVFQSKTFDL